MYHSLKRPLVWQKKNFSLVFSHSAMQIINNKVTNYKSPSTVMVFMHTKQKNIPVYSLKVANVFTENK